jgi:hypothetical protein
VADCKFSYWEIFGSFTCKDCPTIDDWRTVVEATDPRTLELPDLDAGSFCVSLRLPQGAGNRPSQTPPMTSQALHHWPECGAAEQDASNAENNHNDVPERTPICKVGKVEFVQSGVEPAIEPAQSLLLSDGPAVRIEV